MSRHKPHCCRKVELCAVLFFFSCSNPWIRSGPPSNRTETDTTRHTAPADTAAAVEDMDFAEALDSALSSRKLDDQSNGTASIRMDTASDGGDMYAPQPFPVPTNRVRIALIRNTGRAVVYSVGTVRLYSRGSRPTDPFRGRILFESRSKGGGITITAGRRSMEAVLPCTLRSDDEYNYLEIGDTTYRGSIIIAAGRAGTFTVVNFLAVEEYLRGVVPLELGRRPREEIEAIKAQAVAARTYTYRRIVERKSEPYDMVATVADQVYGGVGVEYREADRAIAATADLILTDGDSIILAYYHSTCGGSTADVHDVWGKPPRSYLRPVSDLDESGNAYCRGSAYFTWEESWPWKQFSGIVIASLQRIAPKDRFKGVVNSITVNERFPCGRVKRATITGSGWAYECGGDQVRFILRRGTGGYPLLRSANFTVTSPDRSTIRLKGRGYGHGVGMCQMGAIGRAQAGQEFSTILRAYYTGVTIATAVVGR